MGYTAQVNAGDRAFSRHEYTAAISRYREALVWNATGVAAHLGLGNTYLKIGRKQRALEQFGDVLKLNPHSAEAEHGIHVARTEGQEQEAFQQLEAEVFRDPKSADLNTTYAEELLERGRTAEAKSHAETALTLDKNQWHAYAVLGEIALQQGHLKEARPYIQAAVSHDNTDDDSFLALGDLEFQEGNFPAALKAYTQLVKLVPEEAEGHLKLATVMEKIGRSADALKEKELAAQIEQAQKQKGGAN